VADDFEHGIGGRAPKKYGLYITLDLLVNIGLENSRVLMVYDLLKYALAGHRWEELV
jgi:hypothetical protein